jgi:hypothetical protein
MRRLNLSNASYHTVQHLLPSFLPPRIVKNCKNLFSVTQVNETYGNRNNAVNETEIVGCPSVQKWCYYIPAMTVTQFLLGYAFISVGYPIGVTLIQTIFSKVLGPRPQVSSHG